MKQGIIFDKGTFYFTTEKGITYALNINDKTLINTKTNKNLKCYPAGFKKYCLHNGNVDTNTELFYVCFLISPNLSAHCTMLQNFQCIANVVKSILNVDIHIGKINSVFLCRQLEPNYLKNLTLYLKMYKDSTDNIFIRNLKLNMFLTYDDMVIPTLYIEKMNFCKQYNIDENNDVMYEILHEIQTYYKDIDIKKFKIYIEHNFDEISFLFNKNILKYNLNSFFMTIAKLYQETKEPINKNARALLDVVRLTKIYDLKKNAIEEEKFTKVYKNKINVLKYSNTDLNYTAIIPTTETDFEIEGDQQHNCVHWNYFNSAIEGKYYFAFIRKNDDLKHSWITTRIDTKTGKVLEANRIYNRGLTDEMKNVVRDYEKHLMFNWGVE